MTDTPFTSPLAPAAPPANLDLSKPFEPLAGLKDIHLPEPVSFWPLAPGWWALAGLLLLLAALAILLEWRRRQTLAYQADQAMQAVARDHARYGDARAVAAEATLLMRRVLVTRKGSTEAALVGAGWHRFLSEGKGALAPDLVAFLAEAPYLPPGLPDADKVERAEVVASVRRWIRSNA